MYISLLLETLVVTGPIFLIVILGLVLRRAGFIDDHFVQVSSRLVFLLCLPVLLFTTITDIDASMTLDWWTFGFSLLAACLTFVLAWICVLPLQPRQDRGVAVQASFRSNLGVIGLALCANAYGAPGLALASVLMASLTVVYNILSVFILTWYQEGTLSWRKVWLDILRNPLIIAIGAAGVVVWLDIPVPGVVRSTGEYLGSLALPLALLGTGAGMSLRALRDSSGVTLLVVMLKTILLPGLVVGLAVMAGFSGTTLGVIYLLFVSPTATASYIMVKSMGGNDRLAANLIMTTTLAGILTTSFGLFLLKVLPLG